MATLAGMQATVVVVGALISWTLWLLVGNLAGNKGSLTLAAQAPVLLAVAGTALFVGLTGDPQKFWLEILRVVYADLADQGLKVEVDIEAQAALMTGVFIAFSLVGSLLVLLLGSSWASAVWNSKASSTAASSPSGRSCPLRAPRMT